MSFDLRTEIMDANGRVVKHQPYRCHMRKGAPPHFFRDGVEYYENGEVVPANDRFFADDGQVLTQAVVPAAAQEIPVTQSVAPSYVEQVEKMSDNVVKEEKKVDVDDVIANLNLGNTAAKKGSRRKK